MSISTSTHTLVQVTCDDCHITAVDRADESDYFWSTAEALTHLAETGWDITDERQWCEWCSAERVCAQVGHDWSAWWTPTADPWGLDARPRRDCRRFCRTGHQIADTNTDSRNGGDPQ